MTTTVRNYLKELGLVSVAALALAWSGFTQAGGPSPEDNTLVNNASVKIRYFIQTGEGMKKSETVTTKDVLNYFIGAEPGSKPPKNLSLVLLSYCADPAGRSALAVWDRDIDDLAEANWACLWQEGGAIENHSQIVPWDIEAEAFGFDEIDMDVEIGLGEVNNKTIEGRPMCLKNLRTRALSGYNSMETNGAVGTKVVSGESAIKTNGGIKAVLSGDVVSFLCD